MSIVTGRDAYVNGVACTESWQVNREGSNERYAASCTSRGTGVSNGNINESGSINGLGGEPPAMVMPGTESTFKGVADNTSGSAKVLDGTVLFTSLQITCPFEAGGLIRWTANFGVQGTLTPGSVGAADATYVEHLGAADVLAPTLLDGGANYAIPGFRQWTLNINTPEKTFVQDAKTYRRAGNFEADVTIDVYNEQLRNAKYDINVIDKLKLYISPTTFWHLGWVKFTGAGPVTYDRGTQAIIGYTINGMWSAVHTGALGHITKPSGGALFPPP